MKYFAGKNVIEFAGIVCCKIPFRRFKKYDLVIVRTDRIGDYVIWHDTISAYKQRFQNKKVLLICNDSVSSLAQEEDFFTELLTFNIGEIKKSPRYAFEFIKSLKRIKADTLVNSVWERTWYADIFSLAIRANQKIGILPKKPIGYYINYYNKQYDCLYDCNNCVSEISADEMFAQKAIWEDYRYGCYPLRVSAKSPEIRGLYAVVSFTTSTTQKDWPLDRFVSIINRIPIKYSVVLTGAGRYDEVCGRVIEERVENKGRILNYVGKTSVSEMVALISKATFVIGNDSSAVHIAAATNVPSIAILSGCHYKRFLPYPTDVVLKVPPRVVSYLMDCYNCEYNCIYPDKEPLECIKRITVEMVEKELKLLLDTIDRKS